MKRTGAGIAGGLIAGAAISLVMALGARTRWLHKTLSDDAVDWLNRLADTRRRVGTTGTIALEQINHMMASGAFGLGYSMLRDRLPRIPYPLLGLGYGAALYAVNIAGIAPLIGLTEGEHNASNPLRAERLGVHLLFGLATALAAEGLFQWPLASHYEKFDNGNH
jgi:hypothetical protein